MFEESLIESQNKIKTRRGWTTFLSFGLQVLAVTLLVLLPLVFTEAIPLNPASITQVVAPPAPPPPPPPPAAKAAPRVQEAPVTSSPDTLRVPVKIPQKVAMLKDAPMSSSAAAPPTGVVGGVPGGVQGGQMGGVIGGVLGSTSGAVPKIATPKTVRVSQGVSQGLLEKQVKPDYPPLARQARVQGQVVLHAIIGKDGRVQNLEIVSGHPMLASAAINAVKQWKYKPYYLNGQPVEVETSITVNFNLSS